MSPPIVIPIGPPASAKYDPLGLPLSPDQGGGLGSGAVASPFATLVVPVRAPRFAEIRRDLPRFATEAILPPSEERSERGAFSGLQVVPKSSRPERLAQNLDLFGTARRRRLAAAGFNAPQVAAPLRC